MGYMRNWGDMRLATELDFFYFLIDLENDKW